MNKYQMWLQRKSYTQHLQNLLKIKYSKINPDRQKTPACKFNRDQNQILHFKPTKRYHSSEKLDDLCLAIPYKQQKNKKLHMAKAFQIQNENIHMAKRIKFVKSVVNIQSHCQSAQLTKRREFEKKCEFINVEKRAKKFYRYIKWQSQIDNHKLNKYELKIQVLNFTRHVKSQNQYAGLSCAINTGKTVLKSKMIQLNEQELYKFSFSTQFALENQIKLTFNLLKGLNKQKIGQFLIILPTIGQQARYYSKSIDKSCQVQLKLTYHKIPSQNHDLFMI